MATVTQDSIANILQIVADLRGESTTDTSAARVRAVSRAERTYAKRAFMREHLRRNATLTGDGTGDYTIGDASYPMRKNGLSELFVGGQREEHRYQVVSFFVYQQRVNANSAERLAYEYYDQENDAWKVHINPVVEDDTTIYYSYFYLPPKKTSSSDIVVCNDLTILALLALGDIERGEDEIQKSNLAKQEAEQLIEEELGIDDSPAIGQLQAMGAIENVNRNRGIGNY